MTRAIMNAPANGGRDRVGFHLVCVDACPRERTMAEGGRGGRGQRAEEGHRPGGGAGDEDKKTEEKKRRRDRTEEQKNTRLKKGPGDAGGKMERWKGEARRQEGRLRGNAAVGREKWKMEMNRRDRRRERETVIGEQRTRPGMRASGKTRGYVRPSI